MMNTGESGRFERAVGTVEKDEHWTPVSIEDVRVAVRGMYRDVDRVTAEMIRHGRTVNTRHCRYRYRRPDGGIP